MSQLDLALAAGVSQRHISFLETARSRPSRDMVLQLAGVLDVPLRACNAMLAAAGFTPVYPGHRLDDAAMAHIRRVLTLVLDGYGPFPAYAVDRHWDLVLSNAAAARVTALLPQPHAAAAASDGNMLRLLMHPDGLRPHVLNWAQVGPVLLTRVARDVAHDPGDARLADLHAELRELLDADGHAAQDARPHADDLVVPLHLAIAGRRLRLFTTITTIGAAHDVTLEELRLETLLPADAATEQALRDLERDAVRAADTRD